MGKELWRKGRIFITKEACYPLFLKGDKFKIIKINKDPDLLPIEAMRLKDGEIYGFYENELWELK